MLVVLTGGTGGAKLIHGLSQVVRAEELTIVCNTADDFILHGLDISPDLDTIMYTLAGISDVGRGWGIQNDTFTVLQQMGNLGADTWFKLGDRDFATHIIRTRLLRDGLTLQQVTECLCKKLDVRATILPVSNDRIKTRVQTSDGEISFQEYFVRHRWQPEVKAVFYSGISDSRPAPGVVEAISAATAVIVCPSNPVTSIGPILGVPGIREALRSAPGRIIAVSPIIGASAVSGPAHKLMAAQGSTASALGVAQSYADFADVLFIDVADENLKDAIEALGITVVTTSILMPSLADKRRLAREVMAVVAK